jgi:hypothetical protein
MTVGGQEPHHALRSGFKSVLVNTGAEVAANHIGNLYGSHDLTSLEHKLAHGIAGGAAGAILGDDPLKGAASGATGAVVSEMLMEAVAPDYNDFKRQAIRYGFTLTEPQLRAIYEEELRSYAAIAKLASTLPAFALGQDVNAAFNAADTAVENNALPALLLAPWAPAFVEAGVAALGMATGFVLGQVRKEAYDYFTGEPDTVPYQEYGQTLLAIEGFPDHSGIIKPFMGGYQPYDRAQRPLILYTPLNLVKLWQDQGLSIPTDYPSFNEGFQAWQGGNPMQVLINNNHRMVEEYEVGPYNQLTKRSKKDRLEIHHAPQKHPAIQVIPGYNLELAPSIALRPKEHRRIPTIKGSYDGTARDLLAKSVRDLRNYTSASKCSIKELIELAKALNSDAYRKKD